LIEGASTEGEGVNPDISEGATRHTIDEGCSGNIGDKVDGTVDVSTDCTGNNPDISDGLLIRDNGERYSEDLGVSNADIDDSGNLIPNNETTHIQSNDQTTNIAHDISANGYSPSSVHSITTSQLSPDSQTSMMGTNGSDVLHVESKRYDTPSTPQNGAVSTSPKTKNTEEKSYDDILHIPSYNSDVVLNTVPASPDTAIDSDVHTSPEVKTHSIIHDEQSYDDILHFPSSDSYIAFDDVPASPVIQTTTFTSANPSPSSVQPIEENISPTKMPDLCSVDVAPENHVAITEILPFRSENEDKSVAKGTTAVYDVDGDTNNAYVPDCTQPDDHSVGSDQTPRRSLQMN
jgi:hypothetical protein